MAITGKFPVVRMRRLRANQALRDLVSETELNTERLIFPLFIRFGEHIKKPIASMPGHFQITIDQLETEIQEILALNIKAILLFGIPEKKDPLGKDSYSETGIIQRALEVIKKIAPNLLVISDVCFCEYTDHGHCGVIEHADPSLEVNVHNDRTLELLAMQAVSHAHAGADIIAPSGR